MANKKLDKTINISNTLYDVYAVYADGAGYADEAASAETAGKVSHALSFGDKTYDGSAAKTITAADLGLDSALKYHGVTTTSLSDGSTTNPIVIDGSNHTATAGCVVFSGSKEFVWNGSKWELLGDEGSYKTKQTAVSSPSTSGSTTAFIDTISQDANGKITVTKKNVQFPDPIHDHPVSTTTASVVKTINGGSGSFTPTTKYLHPTTAEVATKGHTHSVTVSGTTGNNSGSTTVADGTLSASGTGDTVATGASGTATFLKSVKATGTDTFVKFVKFENGILTLETASAVTAVGADDTGTAVTGISTSKLDRVTVASHTHTHSYGSSTALTTDANTSGTNVITGLAANTTKATGDITYLESATHTHTGASVASNETVLTGVTVKAQE